MSEFIYKIMIDLKLKQLGLCEEEINIYLVLLKYGGQSVSNISRLSKIGRINCYHYIDRMLEKGVIVKAQNKKVACYYAENPKVFINREIEKLNLAQSLVPELLAISIDASNKPKVQFFEGKEGIKNIFDKMLEVRESEIVSFSNFEQLAKFLPDFLVEHFKQRVDQNIKTRFISPRNKVAEEFCNNFFPKVMDERLLEVFLISPDDFNFHSEITIFVGSIAILNLNEENPIGILIENTELYHTQKAIFDLAWLGATSFITQW